MAKYFGTNGVRGKFDFLNPELAMESAKAIGAYFKSGKIIVVRDARLTGECLKHAVVAGLESIGCSVVDLDIVSAPTAEFMIKKLNANGLIIITASHNPPEWNALKVVDGNGITISRERGEEIEKFIGTERMKNAEWTKIKNSEKYSNASREHINEIKKLVDCERMRKRKLKVVLDCGNGMAALVAPTLFSEIGCETVLINEKIDGTFPGRPSEPTKENVGELIKTVKMKNADCGIAWDGDGDRVIFVDEKGEFVVGDKVFAISALIKLNKGGRGAIITTAATSKAAEDIGAKFGMKTIYTKIGAPYLSEEIARSKGMIGGEEVGGVIWPELSLAKDGFVTAAKVVEALCEKKLSEWIAELPQYFNEKMKIECSEPQKTEIIDGMTKYAKSKKLNYDSKDGIRINFDDSWVIVRPSGTENYVRIFAEAKNPEKAKRLVEEYKKLAESMRGQGK